MSGTGAMDQTGMVAAPMTGQKTAENAVAVGSEAGTARPADLGMALETGTAFPSASVPSPAVVVAGLSFIGNLVSQGGYDRPHPVYMSASPGPHPPASLCFSPLRKRMQVHLQEHVHVVQGLNAHCCAGRLEPSRRLSAYVTGLHRVNSSQWSGMMLALSWDADDPQSHSDAVAGCDWQGLHE